MKVIKWIIFLFFIFCIKYSNAQYPASVKSSLLLTKTNQTQLKAALDYFYKKGDPFKIKCINFLVENMPLHYSSNYYWADSNNKRISFNELDYGSFNEAVAAFDILRAKYTKLHPVPYTYLDIDSIKSDLLIQNVELAVEKYYEKKQYSKITEQDFLEYILPYRTSVEPMQNWRQTYIQNFSALIKSAEPIDTQLLHIGQNIKKWFTNTFYTEERKEPLPRLGGIQLLTRAKGPCEDISDLAAMILRSQGIVATCDMVTFWGTSSGTHFCNGTYNSSGDPIRFDASTGSVKFEKLDREPAKVIRTTYSNQKETIANLLPFEEIPKGFMRTPNYIDVTPLYWETDSFSTTPFKQFVKQKYLFAAVFNYGTWQPTWWAKNNGSSARFTEMSKGIVYLPMAYIKDKNIAAGWPIALGYNNRATLQTDTINTITVNIPEKEKYLKFRPNKKYTLFYWNNKWVAQATQVANASTQKLTFTNVPSNALYILIPEYSQHKDRPFLVDKDGVLQYF